MKITRACIGTLLLALVLFFAANTYAGAHASLVSAEPADGAMTASAPSQIVLTFNEPVTASVLRLIDPSGRATPLTVNEARGNTLIIAPPALGAGTHLLSWRVISADGHPVGGSIVFSIGRISGTPTLAAGPDWSVRAAILIARFAVYVGLFVGVGGAFFVAWVSPLPDRATRVIRIVAAVGLVAAALSIGLQGLDVFAAPLRDLARIDIWRGALDTSYAWTVLLAAIALILSIIASRGNRLCAAAAIVFVGLALAASGHASTATPQWLMRPAVFLHAAAIALWIGALFPLYQLLRTSENAHSPLGHFSRMIPPVIAVLMLAGVTLAVVQVAQWKALWTTAYGQILIVKLVLVALLFMLATANRFIIAPAVMSRKRGARRRLARTIAGEIALVLAIFAVVALWRFTPPPRALAVEPAFVHLHDRRAMADLTIVPGLATIRILHDDFSVLPAKEVALILSNPAAGIEPISKTASPAGDGSWQVRELILPPQMMWEAEIQVFVTDFDKIILKGPIVMQY